jgi:hypothetical protein
VFSKTREGCYPVFINLGHLGWKAAEGEISWGKPVFDIHSYFVIRDLPMTWLNNNLRAIGPSCATLLCHPPALGPRCDAQVAPAGQTPGQSRAQRLLVLALATPVPPQQCPTMRTKASPGLQTIPETAWKPLSLSPQLSLTHSTGVLASISLLS